MSDRHLEIDPTEALHRFAREMSVASELGEGDFAGGQRAFFEALSDRIDPAETVPLGPLLVETATGLGVEFGDGDLETVPDDAHKAGVLAAWGLCLGYVEGIGRGAQLVIAAMQDLREGAGD